METVISTGISPQYVRGWGIDKGIREILQNWLDSKTEFGCTGYVRWSDGSAVVRDYGPGLEMRHLALGISEKTNKSIGKYGEGLKLALLVFAREGRPIVVKAHSKAITPSIAYDERYQTDVLRLHVEDVGANGRTGTTVEFACSKDELDAGKSVFRAFRSKDFDWLSHHDISLPGGHIYVNGARVGRIAEAMFSYHLNEDAVGNVGNRDREVTDMGKITEPIRTMLAHMSSSRGKGMLMSAIVEHPDSWEVQQAPNGGYYMDKRRWRAAFNKVFGDNTVVATGDNNDEQARYHGRRPITVSWRWQSFLSAIGVPSSVDALKKLDFPLKRTPLKNLTEEERAILTRAKELVKKHYSDPGDKVYISESLDKVNRYGPVDGLWHSDKGVIYLNRRVLKSLPGTLDILIHETCHKVSGYSDCTVWFEKALCNIAVEMMLRDC